ncbi:MAG: 50S ribosomal protein L6 [Chloroflexi bacterium]|nr:MAG: 50S ribosomal protein L6 [Chloroflexota bacterium]
MSRIGKQPVVIPAGVTVTINKNQVVVKGPKGELSREFPPEITITQEEDKLIVTRPSDHRHHRAKHGLVRSLLNNMVVGVSEGFKKDLHIEGVGYRASLDGSKLVLNVGYSHPVVFEPPADVSFEVDKSGRELSVKGIDKEVVGELAARIRRVRPPEPYKGKGIRYVGEYIRRKAGKAGKAK